MSARALNSFEDASRDVPGWYGKLSTLGDFAHRRLSPEFIRIGDDWLSRAISASREQLGARWLAVYLNAPVLRYAWAPGIADDGWWFGLLMPSCDNVGRYFPLLVAQRRQHPPQDRLALDHLEAWFDHVAAAATHTLSDQASVETFERALADAPPWPTPGAPDPLVQQPFERGVRYQMAAHATIDRWLHALASDELRNRFAGCSVWWRPAERGSAATASVVSGLPEPSAFAGMLAQGETATPTTG